jgi:N-acetylmuramic acid 6-phosphate etherase
MASWGTLSTEASNPSSEGLDTLTTEDVAALLLEEDLRGLEAARRSREGIAQAATWAAETLAAGGVMMFAGAGTSGRLGILEAAECPPTFGSDPEQIQAVIAGGPEAVFAAREGAEDVSEDGARAARELGNGDLLVALSASSAEVADLVLALDTGPEVLTGSTRLKAGSATKAVLNAITTAAMVRLGKVYGNLMVDLRPGSAKLRDRALRIIEAAGAVSREEAEQLYDATEGEVKTAIVMASCGLGVEPSRERLRMAGGHVRKAVGDQSMAEKGGPVQDDR